MTAPTTPRTPAVILGFAYTGLATARCLVDEGIPVYGVSLDRRDIGRWSRWGKVVSIEEGDRWLERLCDFLASLPIKPVLIPTTDSLALLLAENRQQLEPHARFSQSSREAVKEIIFKDGLYRLACASGVGTPAQLNPVDLQHIDQWTSEHDAPYLLKPFYQNIADCHLEVKNQVVETAAELMAVARTRGFDNLVIQQLRSGGDGNVYDCYGVCDQEGVPIRLASHRRIRQYKQNLGATCYGEIPVSGHDSLEARLFEATRQLLLHSGYHGIFGIEWLHDIHTGELLLIDFNARPFSSIGHLNDCGLNLPLVNYQELSGLPLDKLDVTPQLESKHWIHFSRDVKTLPQRLKENSLTLSQWTASVTGARSYAIWSLRDPLPMIYEAMLMARSVLRLFVKSVVRVGGTDTT